MSASLVGLINPLIYLFVVVRQLDVRVISNLFRQFSAHLVIILLQFVILPLAHLLQHLFHQIAHHNLRAAFLPDIGLDA